MLEPALETYNSRFNSTAASEVCCGVPILPLQKRNEWKTDDMDIVDEALEMFRPLILFKNFKVKGPADSIIVYLTSFICKLLEECRRHPEDNAKSIKLMDQVAKETVNVSDSQFLLKTLGIMKSGSSAEASKAAKYLQECKDVTNKRLQHILFNPQTGDLDRRYWVMFGRAPFLGHKFTTKIFYA